MAGESKKAVFAAIAGNAAIAVIKFAAAAATGSSAMISEGIHSLVDTGNGGLLFLGLKRAEKRPDRTHPFGYGMEVYFWSFIVAVSIFGLGGGMSIYEGIVHIRHPSPLENPFWNYVVLAAAAGFETFSFTVAWTQFRKTKGKLNTWRAIRTGKDPSLFTVVFEDSAALAGLLVAFLGVFLSHELENPYIDGAASVGIGLILVSVAMFLAWETKSLLLGESAEPDVVAEVQRLAEADPAVKEVGPALTMHLGPSDVLLNLEIQFQDALTAEEVHAAVHRIEQGITARYPEFTRIFIEVEALTGAADQPASPT